MRSALQEILSPTDRSGGVALLAFDSHSGVVVRTPSSALIFDPLGIKVEEVNRADAIIITHEHSDHLNVLLETVEGVRIYHPSDSDPFPKMNELAHGAGTDLVLYLGSSLEKALRIAGLVQPRVLLSRYLDPAQTARQLEPMAHGTRGATLRPVEIYRYP